MTFADKIKYLRKRERYSQIKFSQIVGVKPNTVWRWESGKAKPDTNTIMKIAQVLNTSIEYLLGEDNISEQEDVITSIPPKTKEQSMKIDKGLMTYYFSNGEKVEMPAIPELVPAFQQIVANRLKTL